MNSIIERIKNEPVLVSAFVAATLTLLVVFGVPLSPVQSGAIIALVQAGLAFIARSKVSPVDPPTEFPLQD